MMKLICVLGVPLTFLWLLLLLAVAEYQVGILGDQGSEDVFKELTLAKLNF